MVSTSERLISLDDAAARIADRLEARDSYVITIPPSVFAGAVQRIGKLFGSVIYVDNGSDTALELSGPSLSELVATVADQMGPVVTGVAVVPKTAPAGALRRAGLDVPGPDAEQDIVLIEGTAEGYRYVWPELFLMALGRSDPEYVAAIRASAAPGGTVFR